MDEIKRKPTIVCLCGSTRFYNEFQEANYQESMKGNIVITLGWYPDRENVPEVTPDEKIKLDALHFKRIEMADEILVLNINGYIGDSTRREMSHAMKLGKTVRFAEEPKNVTD